MDSKIPIKSVPNPSEQYSTLLHAGNNVFHQQSSFLTELHKNKLLALSDKAVIELMYLYGLRISEVLKIKASQIAPSGHIFIQTLKKGKQRIIIPVKYANFWIAARRGLLPLGNIYSRNYYYRLFKKCGYNKKFQGNENFSVTHYFRHRLVQDLRRNGFPDSSISQFLAHSSGKSVENYG